MAVILIVGWWAFIPPYYEFAVITPRALLNMSVFALASIVTIWFAEAYRRVVDALRVEKIERELLFDELLYRGKNTFAVVSFIITSSLDENKESAQEIIERVKAVSSTNDLITSSKTQTVMLKQILDQEFAPYWASRVTMNGGSIELSALSTSRGAIEITWLVEGTQVRLSWIERGGPQVSIPRKPGFGLRLIVRTQRRRLPLASAKRRGGNVRSVHG